MDFLSFSRKTAIFYRSHLHHRNFPSFHGLFPASHGDANCNTADILCLNAIKAAASNTSLFWFGTDYARNCPPNKRFMLKCSNSRPDIADSLQSRIFDGSYTDTNLDRTLTVSYNSPAGRVFISHLFIHSFTNFSIYLSIYLFIYLINYLFIHLFGISSIYSFVFIHSLMYYPFFPCLFFHSSICLSIHLFIMFVPSVLYLPICICICYSLYTYLYSKFVYHHFVCNIKALS